MYHNKKTNAVRELRSCFYYPLLPSEPFIHMNSFTWKRNSLCTAAPTPMALSEQEPGSASTLVHGIVLLLSLLIFVLVLQLRTRHTPPWNRFLRCSWSSSARKGSHQASASQRGSTQNCPDFEDVRGPAPVGADCALEVARAKAAGARTSEGSDGALARSVFEEFFGWQPAMTTSLLPALTRENTEPLHACGYGPALLQANCPPGTGHDAALQDVLDILTSTLSATPVAVSSRPQGLSASELTSSRSNDCRPASLQGSGRTMAPLPRHHVVRCTPDTSKANGKWEQPPISGSLTQTQTQTQAQAQATRKAPAQKYCEDSAWEEERARRDEELISFSLESRSVPALDEAQRTTRRRGR